jgi:hypothetical protein
MDYLLGLFSSSIIFQVRARWITSKYMVERPCFELGWALIWHTLCALFPISQVLKTKVHIMYSGFVKFCSHTNPLDRANGP